MLLTVTWQLLAIICSFSYALQNLFIKGLTRRRINSLFLLWLLMGLAVPVLLVFTYFTPPPTYENHFPLVLFIAVFGNLFGFYGYVRALELSDVSLVMPLISLTPFFMILTSWLILSELPDLQGLVGILGVVAGTYLLTRSSEMSGFRPFLALFEDPGCRWALFVSFIWSIQANIDKLAARAARPLIYSFWFHVLFTLLLLPLVLFRRGKLMKEKPGDTHISGSSPWPGYIFGGIIAAGTLEAVLSGTQMLAITEIQVSYVVAIKRAGMLVSVLGGGLLFEEEDLPRRFLAASVVFLGLLAIILR